MRVQIVVYVSMWPYDEVATCPECHPILTLWQLGVAQTDPETRRNRVLKMDGLNTASLTGLDGLNCVAWRYRLWVVHIFHWLFFTLDFMEKKLSKKLNPKVYCLAFVASAINYIFFNFLFFKCHLKGCEKGKANTREGGAPVLFCGIIELSDNHN